MHIRRLVRGSIKAINRDRPILWLASRGTNLSAGGVATPTYYPAQRIFAQIQPLPTDQLAHMEQLNIQGVLRQVFMRGAVASAVRADGTGGDLLQFPERFVSPFELAAETSSAWTADSNVTADSSSDTASGTQPIRPSPLRTWLVVLVTEQWSDWCRVVARLQNDMNNVFTADSSTTADSGATA